MDIAKYIGLFLLKNEYCYLPGIGSLQVVKKSAAYDNETHQLTAPVYAVEFQHSSGSIDDAFANFIANNERISIAHASNYLKDFCSRAKIDLKAGKEIIIPGIGKFFDDPGQGIQFSADPHLQIKGRAIPFFKNSTGVEQKREDALTQIIERTSFREPKADEEIVMQPPQVNWPKIIILILVVLAVLAGLIFIFSWSQDKNRQVQPVGAPVSQAGPLPESSVPADLRASPSPTAAPGPDRKEAGGGRYKVSINQYPDLDAARSRVQQLTAYGNEVEVWTGDSVSFSVIMYFPASVNPNFVTDSLRKLFNPKGKVMVVDEASY